MPFRRTDIRHRLYDAIFRCEIPAKGGGEVADRVKAGEQIESG
jgi:hypothetical protein